MSNIAVLSELPEGWRSAALGEVAEINPRGGDRSLADGTEVSFVPMAAISEVSATITTHESRLLANVRKGFTAFREGDVLFAKITPCMENGKVAIAYSLKNQRGFGSTEFHVIRPRPGVTARWIRYHLRRRAIREEAAQHMTGSGGLRRLPSAYLVALPIPLPPSQGEQERIADILDEADAARELCRERERTFDRFTYAVFDELFGHQDALSERWQSVRLESLANVIGGLQLTPARSGSPGVPYLRVANVYRNRIDLRELKLMKVSEAELASRALVRGDVLIVEGHGNLTELGRAAVWEGTQERCVHQNHLIRARCGGPRLRPEYLAYLINSQFGRQYFQRHSKSSAGLENISVSVVRQLPVLLPPLALQETLARMVGEVSVQQQQHTKRAELIEHLFSDLLDGAFHGGLSGGLAAGLALAPSRITPAPQEQTDPLPDAMRPTSRPIWRKLSETQRRIWERSWSFARPFSLTEISKALRAEPKPSSREHLIWALDLLVTLGVVIREDRRGIDLWRRPSTEEEKEIEV